MDEMQSGPEDRDNFSTLDLSRRTLILAGAGLAAMLAIPDFLSAESASAAVDGYNLPFTNLAQAGTNIPSYNPGYPWSPTGHNGIDFNGPSASGRNVFPIRAGVVSQTIQYPSGAGSSGLGTQVFVDHSDGRQSRYCHLASKTVSAGAVVTPATQIGTVGTTGSYSDGNHLHLELRNAPGGADIDPWPFLEGAPYANQVPTVTVNGDTMAILRKRNFSTSEYPVGSLTLFSDLYFYEVPSTSNATYTAHYSPDRPIEEISDGRHERLRLDISAQRQLLIQAIAAEVASVLA